MRNRTFWYAKNKLRVTLFRIVCWLSAPFIFIKGICDNYRLQVDYPDRWERYCEQRRRENTEKKFMARLQLAGANLRHNLCLLGYINTINRNDSANLGEIATDFKSAKEEAIAAITSLEELGVSVPDTLQESFIRVRLDEFNNAEDWEAFAGQTNIDLQSIEIS